MRLDLFLVEKGIVESRARAQALILAGKVLVDGKRAEKAGVDVNDPVHIKVQGGENPYVSRGGIKLEAALKTFNINCVNMIALDIGASTGGFTDCLLQYGAKRVYALDVGYGQLAWRLRNDERVIILEKVNVRYLAPEIIHDTLDIVTIDCSFISLKLILPKIFSIIANGVKILALVKPQFEVGKGEVGKGGVVRDKEKHRRVLKEISTFAISMGLNISGIIASPILGPKGNREFFLYLLKGGDHGCVIDIDHTIEKLLE